jgi:Response regulator of the LytR/AlgR family
LRILICDDDQYIVEQLKKYIVEFFKFIKLKIPEIQTYNSGEDLLCDSGVKDIIFLDVEMPGFNGIYVGRELKSNNPNLLIFIITSYVEYLDEAMRFHVFRYLSKPLDKQRLFQNMKDAIQVYNTTNIKIPIETKEGVFTSIASEIIFIEAQNRTVTVHTLSRDLITKQKIAHWTNILNIPCFFQTHRSFIINLKYVTNFDHSLIYLHNNQYSAYLTRRKFSQFKEAYFLYLESTR